MPGGWGALLERINPLEAGLHARWRGDSNPQPCRINQAALPIELRQRNCALEGLWERYRAAVSQAERRDWLALELALSLLGNELKRLLDGAGREARR